MVEAFLKCGLLQREEADNVQAAIGFFGGDFFEFMGLVYSNAGMFICALRWYRELIVELETRTPDSCSDYESIYASVGYCLYALGLFEEAIAWSKSCIGPRAVADVVCRALIEYEAELAGGAIRAIERAGSRTRYTVAAFDPDRANQATPRLKSMAKTFAPFHDVYIDWVSPETPSPEIPPDGYPFRAEYDGGSLVRHKMNLIFATCAHADALVEKGYRLEARRLLSEVVLLEPGASFALERLEGLSFGQNR